MTIEVRGHVHALEFCGVTAVKVTLQLEANRLAHPHQISVLAKPEEIAAYKIGMPVIVQVRPA